MKALRPYQDECIGTVLEKQTNGCNRQLVVLATGMGKTFTAVKIIEQFAKRTLWITHTEDLIEQSALSILENMLDSDHVDHIRANDGIIEYLRNNKSSLFHNEHDKNIVDQIGIVKRDLFEINKPLVVASIQTLHRRLDKIPPDHFDMIIVDEAHLSAAATWTKAIEHFSFDLLLGLTATPYRADGVSLTHLFDEIIFERDIAWGIEHKYLCELEAYRVKTGTDISKVSTQAGDFNQKELGKEIDNEHRNNLIVAKYKEYAQGRPFIAFCLNIEHAMNLSQAFNDNGINTTFVVSDEELCPDRRERIEGFKAGQFQGLINVNILTAGFDYPGIECVIMARPTKSLTMYLQSIGRGTRIKPSGKNCIILDIVDVTGKHSLINTWTLDKGKRIEDMVFMSERQRELLIEKREQNKVRIEKEIERDGKVDLLKLPDVVIYDSHSNREVATKAQLDFIAKLGHDIIEQSWTKGQCSEVISALPCSADKLKKLQDWGYDVSKGATAGQFSKIEAAISRESKFKSLINNSKIVLPFKNMK